jgi:outer membrane receptor protein involved in Fe transport
VGGFSSRISLFYQGEYNQTFSTDGTRDVIVNPFTRLDLILKQEIIQDHLSIMLNFNNLTNVQEGTTIVNRDTGWKLENETERYGRTAALVMRVTL